MLPSCGCLFFGFSHCWIWENIGILTCMDCDVPLCTMRTAKTITKKIETLPLLQPSLFQEQKNKASPDFCWTSQDFILSIEMIIFGILMNLAFSWLDTSVLEAFALSKLDNLLEKRRSKTFGGLPRVFWTTKNSRLLESHEFCIFSNKNPFFWSQERVQFSSRNYDFTARWVFLWLPFVFVAVIFPPM